MENLAKLIFCIVCVSVSACGGNSSDSMPPTFVSEPKNVAASSNGGVASASYDNPSAGLVNDGETSVNFWAGNAVNDVVTIAFDNTYSLSEIKIFTNATNNVDTELQISTDGVNFTAIPYLGGSQPCFSLSMGSGVISCGLDPKRDASHVRLEILNASASTIQIFEIEAQGS